MLLYKKVHEKAGKKVKKSNGQIGESEGTREKGSRDSRIFRHAEFAAAVELVVEVVFVQQLVAAVLQPSFAPVLCPKACAFHGFLCG